MLPDHRWRESHT